VIIASQPRPVKNGVPLLTPEEQWSLRHGMVCAAAGLQVRVARLPLLPGEDKAEIDSFLTTPRRRQLPAADRHCAVTARRAPLDRGDA